MQQRLDLHERSHKMTAQKTSLISDIYRVSYSGLTQPGCPALSLKTGPHLCNAANTGTETKNVMIPWAAKVHVKPEAVSQGAMKNWNRLGQR